jgi:hypothetical protein
MPLAFRQAHPGSTKRRHVSEQTQRDNVRLNDRLRRNTARMTTVEQTLSQFGGRRTMMELLCVAHHCVVALNGAVQIDRLARRSRLALMCWFCENWPVVWEHVFHFYGAQPQIPVVNFLDRTPVPSVEPILSAVNPDVDIGPLSILNLLNH